MSELLQSPQSIVNCLKDNVINSLTNLIELKNEAFKNPFLTSKQYTQLLNSIEDIQHIKQHVFDLDIILSE